MTKIMVDLDSDSGFHRAATDTVLHLVGVAAEECSTIAEICERLCLPHRAVAAALARLGIRDKFRKWERHS